MPSIAQQLDVRAMSLLFKALGDEQRLRIVALLSHGELCVCHVESALQMSQPTASRLLAVLRNAGVVEVRRTGGWAYYKLAPQADAMCRAQLAALSSTFGNRKVLSQDIERLVKSRGPGACK